MHFLSSLLPHTSCFPRFGGWSLSCAETSAPGRALSPSPLSTGQWHYVALIDRPFSKAWRPCQWAEVTDKSSLKFYSGLNLTVLSLDMSYLSLYTAHSLCTAISPSPGRQVGNVCPVPCSHLEPTSYPCSLGVRYTWVLFCLRDTQLHGRRVLFGCVIPF